LEFLSESQLEEKGYCKGIIWKISSHLFAVSEFIFKAAANSPSVALKENRIKDLAGNYIIIKHNESEYSHLYHLLKGSCKVKVGDVVKRDQEIGKVGFSGASTVYSHLHYQLLDGIDILNSNELPIKFSNVILWHGTKKKSYDEIVVNTGDIIEKE